MIQSRIESDVSRDDLHASDLQPWPKFPAAGVSGKRRWGPSTHRVLHFVKSAARSG
jgi:hypothetical protein